MRVVGKIFWFRKTAKTSKNYEKTLTLPKMDFPQTRLFLTFYPIGTLLSRNKKVGPGLILKTEEEKQTASARENRKIR